MSNLSISLDLTELAGEIIDIEAEHKQKFKEAIANAGSDAVNQAKDNVMKNGSYKTGEMIKSITTKTKGLTTTITVGAKQGVFIEEGTRAHVIKPKKASVLSFYVGGSQAFAKRVNHPGTKAKPFLEPAVDTASDAFIKRIGDVLDGRS